MSIKKSSLYILIAKYYKDPAVPKSVMSDSATPWTVAHQTPLSTGFSRQELEWVSMPSSRGSSRPRDQTRIASVSCISRQVLYH